MYFVNYATTLSQTELIAALKRYTHLYPHHIPQRRLKHQTPIHSEEKPTLDTSHLTPATLHYG
jgi:hypothetical protein